MTIRACRVSDALLAGAEFCRAYDLAPYDPSQHRDMPTLFVGLYGSADLATLCEHEGSATLLFAGTDARNASWCAETLRHRRAKFGLRVLSQPGIAAAVRDRGLGPDAVHAVYVGDPAPFFDQPPLGPSVYVYCPFERREEYGLPIITEVAAAFREISFLLGRWGEHPPPFRNAVGLVLRPQAEMAAVYADCFGGFRAIEKDALGGTNIEMALMGRPVAHVIDVGLPWIRHAPDAQAIIRFVERAGQARAPDATLAAQGRALVASRSFLAQ